MVAVFLRANPTLLGVIPHYKFSNCFWILISVDLAAQLESSNRNKCCKRFIQLRNNAIRMRLELEACVHDRHKIDVQVISATL